jgi:hypothetical protein
MAPVTLTGRGFHSAAVEDGDAAMASLDRAEVLECETRCGGAGALEAESAGGESAGSGRRR